YHQFWINAADADVEAHLKRFTLLDREQIEQIMAEHSRDPGARVAQRALAREATTLLHGWAACQRAEAIAEALFRGDVRSLDTEALRDAFAEAPSSEHDAALLEGEGLPLVELLPQTTLASSKRQAKQLLAEGAVSVNSERAEPSRRLTCADLLHNEAILLRRGKKHWHLTRWKRQTA
ncbi:MAG: tyrosine--tRNA ligase, partial [Planctomycetota bacterium]